RGRARARQGARRQRPRRVPAGSGQPLHRRGACRARAAGGLMTTSAKGRVFVLDDDQSVVDYLVEMLVERGFEAVGDTRVSESLERIATDPFDVVVSDIEMPEQRGLDFMNALHERRPEQLVVLMTA